MSVFAVSAAELEAEKARIAAREADIAKRAADEAAAKTLQPVRITLADKAAGRGPELAEQARREGRPIEVEPYESHAGRAIRAFAQGSTREDAIAAGRASAGGFHTRP